MRRVTLTVGVVLAVLLTQLLASCSNTADPWQDVPQESFVISTGNPTGVYAEYGARLAEVIGQRSDVDVEVLASGGSVENLRNLADGRADLAFSAADAAADAAEGRGSFDEGLPVRALARVYDDFVHLVVPESSPVRTIGDLRGRTIAIGAPDSGTALIAGRLFQAAGIDIAGLDTRALSLDASIEALRGGAVDALFWSGGLRTPALTELEQAYPIRLVPLDQLVDRVRTEFGSGYRHGSVPAGVYGLPDEVPTLALPNMLVVRTDMPDALAYALLESLFTFQDQLAETVPAAAILDRSKAIFTEPVLLHPAAARYYRDTKQ
jgi:TRAP transporter TAXI family solute receptor